MLEGKVLKILSSTYNRIMKASEKKWFPPFLLLGSVLLVYAACFRHEFIPMWDDGLYILGNEAAMGVSLNHLKLAFTSSYGGNYAPLHIISYMIDYSLWGLAPAGFIGTNLLLHALNGYLLYLVLSAATGSRPASLLAALFFCVHPVQVESVAWISERKNVLSLFFMLLAMVWYGKYTCPLQEGEGKKLNYIVAFFFFVLALLTKSVVVVLPALLFGWDYLLLGRRDWKRLLRDVAPFLFLSIAFSLFTVYSQGLDMGGGRPPLHTRPLWMTILTMLPVLLSYVKMIALPLSLSPWYEPVVRSGFDRQVLGSLLMVVILFGVAISLARRGMMKELYWGTVFFVGLLPVSNLIPIITMMNDRYLYLPMLGVSGLVCSIISRYVEKRTVVISFAAILVILSLLSYEQTAIWKNNVTLWNAAYRKNPESVLVMVRLARSYKSAGMPDKAFDLLQAAIRKEPENSEVLFRLGELTLENLDPHQAKGYLDTLYQHNPRHFEGLLALGREAFLRKSYREAERYFGEALALKPEDTQALIWKSNVYQETGQKEAARTLLIKALVKAGARDRGGIYYNLACLEVIDGRQEQAFEMLEKAVNNGFSDLGTLLQNRDFAPMRNNPRFRAIEFSISGGRGK